MISSPTCPSSTPGPWGTTATRTRSSSAASGAKRARRSCGRPWFTTGLSSPNCSTPPATARRRGSRPRTTTPTPATLPPTTERRRGGPPQITIPRSTLMPDQGTTDRSTVDTSDPNVSEPGRYEPDASERDVAEQRDASERDVAEQRDASERDVPEQRDASERDGPQPDAPESSVSEATTERADMVGVAGPTEDASADPDAPTASDAQRNAEAEQDSLDAPDGATTPTVHGSERQPGPDTPAELGPGDVAAPQATTLWAGEDSDALRERWRGLQSRFVDDPHGAAAAADDLVGQAVESITEALATQRRQLGEWRAGGELDTERLRVAVKGYRDFLDRVLSI